METLDIIYFRTDRKSCFCGKLFVDGELCKTENLGFGSLMVSGRGFFERFDAAQGKGCLYGGLKDISYAFSLHGLDIAVGDQGADGSPDGVAGTVINQAQLVFGRQQLLEFEWKKQESARAEFLDSLKPYECVVLLKEGIL